MMNFAKTLTIKFNKHRGIKLMNMYFHQTCITQCSKNESGKSNSSIPVTESEATEKQSTYFQDYKNIYENSGLFQSTGTLQAQQLSGDYHEVQNLQNSINKLKELQGKAGSNASDEDGKYYDQYYKMFNSDNENGSSSTNDDYYDKYHKLVQAAEMNRQQTAYEQNKCGKKLTHTNVMGQLNMVDVGHKPDTVRVATASAKVWLGGDAYQLVKENKMKKGDVISTAKVAGIMAAKNTSNLIPLCHPLMISNVNINMNLLEVEKAVIVECEVHTKGKTGVEMEALTGVSVAALTIYDMCKAVTHNITITDVQLMHKSGGMRGDFFRSS